MKVLECLEYLVFKIFPNVEGFTFFGNIYFKEKNIDNIPINLIAHEKKHLKQQENGYLKWIIKYLFSREFRYKQEMEAYRESVAHGLSVIDAIHYLKNDYFLKNYLHKKGYSTKYLKKELEG